MASWIRNALAAAAVAGLAPLASASVLNFDNLSGSAFFTSDYQGFQFGNNDAATNAWFWSDDNSDSAYQAASPFTYVSTDASLNPDQATLVATMPITSSTDFIFEGANFTGYDTVEFQLYLNGALVATSAESSELSGTPTFVSSGYGGAVDEVVVLGTQGYFAMDDFTYEAISAVPEPTNLALMAIGALGLVTAAKRRRA